MATAHTGERINFGTIADAIEIPNLIEVQLKSYSDFLQLEIDAKKRKGDGLQAVFTEVFPIESYDEKIKLEFVNYEIQEAKMSDLECQREGITFSAPLYVTFRLNNEGSILEEKVYMGELPMMTLSGTFIVNGAERVVVSQLHRSPGICFESSIHANGKTLYSFRIIPDRGSWLEVAFDTSDLLYVHLDRRKRRRKFLLTTFLRALGYSSNEEIISLFYLLSKYEFPGDTIPIVKGSALKALESGDAGSDAAKCILELMDAVDKYIPMPERPKDKPFLMAVEDVFNIAGRGTVATGRVERGILNRNDEIEIVGLRPTVKTVVTDIEMFRKILDSAEAGDNVGILLRGVKKEDVERGQVLAKTGSITPHTNFKANVYVLSKDEGGRHTPFFNGYRPQFYFRTTDVTGVAKLKEGVEMVMPGDNVELDIELITPIAMEESIRFAIREGGRTVGAGRVTKINK